jgi:chemotaxis protein methyltransferase CheR
MTAAIAGLARLIRQETGIMFSPAQETSLRAALGRAAPGLSPDAFLRAVSDPAQAGELLPRLIDEVTVQETTFARDRDQLDTIPWAQLRERVLAGGAGAVRVWCAGCATGEEAYTLALLATEACAPAAPLADVLGTDISGAALGIAEAGRYRSRAVRGLAATVRRRYFGQQDDGTYLVGPLLRGLVRFRRHNLARDAFPPPGEALFDVVICRNVLIYFPAALAEQVISSFERSLSPGGVLVLGAADGLQRAGKAGGGTGRRAGPGQARTRPAGRPARQPSGQPPRRPLTRRPPQSREEQLAGALAAADQGDRGRAAGLADTLLAADPLDADAHFIRGLVALDAGDPAGGVAALRRALYVDPTFALAAFTLARAHDAQGDPVAAQRAYGQALRLLDPDDHRHEVLLQQVDIGDIAAACRARLGG